MIRLAISVEGRTEEEFVKHVLAERLRVRDVEPCASSLNGNVTVERVADRMANLSWNFEYVTSLVDFYGFRDKGGASRHELEQRINELAEVRIGLPKRQPNVSAYIQQYEFEGLLFSNVNAFGTAANASEENVEKLLRIRSACRTPEDINDNPSTAPSKRLEKIMPYYRKVVYGRLVAEETGLDVIRAECPRFNEWVTRLESLGNSRAAE